MSEGAVAFPDLGADGIAGVDDLFHLLFDGAEIFGSEGLFAVEIVIPAVLDDGADGDLHIGPDFLHGAGHDVGQIVAHQFQRGGAVFHRVDGDGGVIGDWPLQIPMRTIDGGGDRFFRQRGGDGGGDFGRGDACIVVARIAIGECQGNLAHWPSSSSVWRPRNARLRVIYRTLLVPYRGRAVKPLGGSGLAKPVGGVVFVCFD